MQLSGCANFFANIFAKSENVEKFEAAGFAIRDTFADPYVNGLYHLNFNRCSPKGKS